MTGTFKRFAVIGFLIFFSVIFTIQDELCSSFVYSLHAYCSSQNQKFVLTCFLADLLLDLGHLGSLAIFRGDLQHHIASGILVHRDDKLLSWGTLLLHTPTTKTCL